MNNRGRVVSEYQVVLRYDGLTMDELCRILTMIDNGTLRYSDYEEHLDLNIGKDFKYDCDGWEEAAGTYNITLSLQQCSNVDKESWTKYVNDCVQKSYDEGERIRQFIKAETGIE